MIKRRFSNIIEQVKEFSIFIRTLKNDEDARKSSVLCLISIVLGILPIAFLLAKSNHNSAIKDLWKWLWINSDFHMFLFSITLPSIAEVYLNYSQIKVFFKKYENESSIVIKSFKLGYRYFMPLGIIFSIISYIFWHLSIVGWDEILYSNIWGSHKILVIICIAICFCVTLFNICIVHAEDCYQVVHQTAKRYK